MAKYARNDLLSVMKNIVKQSFLLFFASSAAVVRVYRNETKTRSSALNILPAATTAGIDHYGRFTLVKA